MDSGVAGVLQRRSEVDDVSIFNTLLNASGGPALFRATFGQYNFSMMIESSVSALIGVAEEEGKCLGFLAVNDSPSVSTENDTFLATVTAVAAYLPGVKATNTLFLNFFLVDETSRYDSDKVSFDLVRNAFVSSPLVDYIVWLCPSKVRLGFWMEDNFVNVPLPREEDGGGGSSSSSSSSSTGIPAGVKLLYMHRNAFMPKLLVRTARVEDNDDLLPILRSSNPQIVEGQSGFFLADLIQSQDQRNRFLVGVYENSPVGMLATSLDVNVALITKIFDIDCYHDIVVPKEQKPHPPPLFISVMGEIRSVAKAVMRDVVSGMNCLFVDAEDVLSSTQTAASSEEKGGEEEETKLARLAMTELKQHIARGVAQAAAKNQHPTTCVVVGFPRNDTEAHEMATGFMGFDILLEVSDEAKLKADHDEDEADSFLRQHLDAVEALHSFSESQQPRRLNTPWYRVTLGTDGNTNEKDFHTCMHNIVEQRAHEVERILALEEEEPDRANAFAVTVFCADREFQSRGDDLLRVAFEDNPKLDYCLYMVANSAPPTPLTSSMVLVKQRVGVTFDQTLYIVHRDAVVATDLLRVERLSSAQMGQVEKFSAPLTSLGGKARSLLHAACAESLKQNDMDLKDNPPDVSFVVLMGEEVVGIMTTSRACLGTEDVLWMRCNYHVDEVINFDRHRLRAQSQITNFVINPVYSKWTRYILREVMRKCMKSLLWFQNPAENPAVQEIIEELIPVAPRRRMQPTPGAALPMIEKPNSNGVSVQSPLFYLTKRQLTELKICIPKKIIVIGGGSASYAILEKLLFVPNLTLPNLQLVMELPPKAFKTNESDPSLEYSEKCSGDLSYDDADDPSMAELSALGLAHRISIVRGRLTDIDRANKAIVISDEIISEYNMLVIASSTKDCSTKKFPTTAGTHPSHCAFRGMFGLGDAASDAAALTWVRRQTSDRLQVIVYGHDLEAIGAVGALLHKGVDPSRITAVISSAPKIADIAHPFLVESAVRNLRNSGVYIKMGFEIVDVQLTKFGSIESVQLQSVARDAEEGGGGGGLVTMNCYSLLCCGTKYCDSDVFAAINDSGIVFDGGVVVDKNFATNDPNIMAVGSFSRFSRVFRDEHLHSKYSSRELGLFVGEKILSKHLDMGKSPLGLGHAALGTSSFASTNALVRPDAALPKFKFPKTISCPLPNDRTFFHSTFPSTATASDAVILLTGDLNSERVSVLKLDSLGMVIELVSVGKGDVEAKNLGRLPGWHESYLNGAVVSYEQGLVEDWIDFFRGDWATALFHDAFPELAETLRSSLQSDKYAFSLVDLMLDAADKSSDDHEVASTRKKELGPRGEKMPPVTYKMIESATVDYLRKNKAMLTRFAIPALGKK